MCKRYRLRDKRRCRAASRGRPSCARSQNPAAKYLAAYTSDFYYCWDELTAAAWLDPSLITKKESRYMDVDLDRGAGYGNTLTWTDQDRPKLEVQPVEVQVDLDAEKFYKMFVDMLRAPTPQSHVVER